jgi:uncharacterized protein (TIGR02145 family)
MRVFFLVLFAAMSAALGAQAPALIPYQAIARDASGQPLASATINARFTIHDLTATGAVVWQELQTVSTSVLGLFTAQLGGSIPLTGVNWANGNKFMQVEIDLGNGFIDMGTQQMLSVPYALYAGNAPDDQQLAVSETGDTLFLENGGFVIIPGISSANNSGGGTSTGSALHSCGAANVHNPDLTYGSMTDQEGNVYKTIVIGTQEWMAENLNTSVYRNGDDIPTVLDDTEWSTTTSGAWAHFNNDASYSCPYGKLYNWYTCVDPRGLCPIGWHVPSQEEWFVLTDYLGGEAIAGGKMKSTGNIEAGTGLWYDPNEDATNSCGFSGLPGRFRGSNGIFYNIGINGSWWSSIDFSANDAWGCYLTFANGSTDGYATRKAHGFSVRCLRD